MIVKVFLHSLSTLVNLDFLSLSAQTKTQIENFGALNRMRGSSIDHSVAGSVQLDPKNLLNTSIPEILQYD